MPYRVLLSSFSSRYGHARSFWSCEPDFNHGLLGFWEATLHGFDPDIKYTGIEVSRYLCTEYGWKRTSIVDFQPRGEFDLIICQDVLPYLDDREVRTALKNIAGMCRGALYVQVVTKEDWEDKNCDRKKTDPAMRRRAADWYRKILARDFVNCGGGSFYSAEKRCGFVGIREGGRK